MSPREEPSEGQPETPASEHRTIGVEAVRQELHGTLTSPSDAEKELRWNALSSQMKDDSFSPAALSKLMRDGGFQGGKSGTYKSPTAGAFLYQKDPHLLPTEAEALKTSALMRQLTQDGLFHPQTQWGVCRPETGEGWQVFAIMKALQPCDGTSEAQAGQEPLLTAQTLEKEQGGDLSMDAIHNALMDDERSHVRAWFRKLDPAYDFNGAPADPRVAFLNQYEAFHPDNWGWDPQTGKLYPVDVEVVNVRDMREELAEWNFAA